ncbi:MAG TPA: BrnT family toxin [Acidobacteriaceae bacterium]|nr:BrnT family toxin [Acidobacteriaceae bacterium]
MRFDWDESKDKSNFRKHGIHFGIAVRVFDDPEYVMEQDREVDDEERWQTIGWAGEVLLLLMAHTVEDDDDELVVRIISARKATAKERKRYEGNTH